MAKKTKTMPPIHPGETLREDFLKPLGLTANRLAMELMVPVTRVNDIARGKRAITADTALRLSRYFGTTPQFWTNLQANYDLDLAEDARGAEIAATVVRIRGGACAGELVQHVVCIRSDLPVGGDVGAVARAIVPVGGGAYGCASRRARLAGQSGRSVVGPIGV